MVVVGYNGSLDIDQILFPQEHYIAGTTMFEHSRALNEVFNNMGQIYEIVNKNLFSTLLSRKLFDTCFRQQVEDQAQTYNTDDWKVIGVSFSPIGFFLEGNTVNDRCMYRMGATFLVDKR